MFNAMGMELYRMFKSRGFYVMAVIIAAAVMFTAYTEKEWEKTVMEEGIEYEQALPDTESLSVGMSVEAVTKPGQKMTVQNMLFANIKAKFFALFMVIFAVNFSIADLSSGYIKNIGGQVSCRRNLIVAKTAALFVYTVLCMVSFLVLQVLANRIIFGYVLMGDGAVLARYMLTQAFLHFALLMICMTVTLFLRSHAASMIVAIFLCMNVQSILYDGMDRLLSNVTGKDFHMAEHVVTGKISLLPLDMTGKECRGAVAVAAGFVAVMLAAGILNFEKRDIV